MECCGKDRDTRFCPDCGAMLRSSPLYELLKYCQERAKADAAKSRSIRRDATRYSSTDADARHRERCAVRAANLDQSVARWQLWADELEKIVDSSGA